MPGPKGVFGTKKSDDYNQHRKTVKAKNGKKPKPARKNPKPKVMKSGGPKRK